MSSLNPDANYEELVSVRLVGMMLTIVVRQELRKNVIQTETQTVTSGALYKFLVSKRRPIFSAPIPVTSYEAKQ